MDKPYFYVTTPIYYVNDKPHIGHAYTTILADVLARYYRSLEVPSFFLTGTDEHGQKVQKAAEEHGITPQEQCDTTVVRFQELWDRLEITNDRFIRTTEPAHKAIVQSILQKLYDQDLIYRDEYSGHYCVPCERFYTEKDLDEGGLCPECKRPVQEIIESNYFFRMSKYQDWLINYIKDNPDFIQPSFRANETLGFLKKTLGDLCISRPKARLAWGIELPFDNDYVCYVWFDALINYISGVGYGSDDEQFKKWWPASYHLIGKDILTTHTVYWPTMLKAIGLEMPKTIFAHGWWLTGRSKMSKSLGNVVNPMEMIDKYGLDAFRYFLMAEMTLGQDASFTEDAFITRFNSDLANDLGNLASRVIKFTLRSCDGIVPEMGEAGVEEAELAAAISEAETEMEKALAEMRLEQGIEKIMAAIRAGNRYMEQTAPWSLAKKGELAKLNTVMNRSADLLWRVSILLTPVMPGKMKFLQNCLGFAADAVFTIKDIFSGEVSIAGNKVEDTGGLFQRITVENAKPESQPLKKQKQPVKTEPKKSEDEAGAGLITFDEFFNTRLKTAKVVDAERIEGTDKLLKLQIDVGGEARQLVAGVAEAYSPEDIIGKTIVIVANLKPAKIRGVLSQGMLLAAKDPDGLRLITVDGHVGSGITVG